MKLQGVIDDNGKLVFNYRDMLIDWLNENKGKKVTFEIKVDRKKRSNNQNSYYWGIVIEIMYRVFREAGLELDTPMDAHDILKAKFNKEVVCNNQGEVIEVVKSTTKNNTFEQEEYHEKIRKWALEFWGVIIPLPNEQLEMQLNNYQR